MPIFIGDTFLAFNKTSARVTTVASRIFATRIKLSDWPLRYSNGRTPGRTVINLITHVAAYTLTCALNSYIISIPFQTPRLFNMFDPYFFSHSFKQL